MTIVLILFAGILTVLLGRWMFGRWFNHVGLYGVAWGFPLVLFELRLINYYPLETETWLIIAGSWVAFVLGSATAAIGRFTLCSASESKQNVTKGEEYSLRSLVIWLLALNAISFLDVLHKTYIVTQVMGSFTNIFTYANYLYKFRIEEGIPGAIPYLGSANLIACLLAGMYLSESGRLRLLALTPILISVWSSVVSVGRAPLIVCGILFVSGYFLSRRRIDSSPILGLKTKFKRVLSVVLVLGIVVGGLEFIRSKRAIEGAFSTVGSSFERLGVWNIISPSIYFYVSGNFGVLNQYLKRDNEHRIVGNYTLAPVWRTLSRVGFDSYVRFYPPFYRTPLVGNSATYLRELHADYRLIGVIFGPYSLGLLCSLFWLRLERRRRLFEFVVLSHLNVVVGMSVFYAITISGYWLASLLFGIILSLLSVRRGMGRRGAVEAENRGLLAT